MNDGIDELGWAVIIAVVLLFVIGLIVFTLM